MRLRGVLLAMACLASACATRTAAVDQRLILPDGAARYEMAAHQAFVFPAPRGNPPPAFPAGFDRHDLPPTTLCASLVVDAEGGVRDVVLLDDAGCAGRDTQPQLGAAVLDAVSSWRFDPAMFCDYPDEATRNRDWTGVGCAGAVADARPVAVTLAYAFTFEVRNGKARVGSDPLRDR